MYHPKIAIRDGAICAIDGTNQYDLLAIRWAAELFPADWPGKGKDAITLLRKITNINSGVHYCVHEDNERLADSRVPATPEYIYEVAATITAIHKQFSTLFEEPSILENGEYEIVCGCRIVKL